MLRGIIAKDGKKKQPPHTFKGFETKIESLIESFQGGFRTPFFIKIKYFGRIKTWLQLIKIIGGYLFDLLFYFWYSFFNWLKC